MKKAILKLNDEEMDTINNALDLLESQVAVGGSFPDFEYKLSKIRRKINDYQASEMGRRLYGKDK